MIKHNSFNIIEITLCLLVDMGKGNVENKQTATHSTKIAEPAKILIENGPEKGKEFSVDKLLVTIGRNQGNDISLFFDTRISRYHGQILFDLDTGTYYYEDLNSTNGTTICDKWFKNDRVKLKHGDTILIGTETKLRFFNKKFGLQDWLRG